MEIAALLLPPETAKGGYDTSRTASHRDLSWHPFSSTLTPMTCQPPSPESLQMLGDLAIMHADAWSNAHLLPREQWVDDWVDTSIEESLEDFKGDAQQRYGTVAFWVPQWLFWLRDRNY